MKVEVKGKYLYFRDFTNSEFVKLNRLLSWEDKFAKTIGKTSISSLLLQDKEGTYYTFYGIADLIKDEFSAFDFTSEEGVETHPLTVSNTVLKNITLRDYQVMAIRKAVNIRRGILELPTSAGKTEVALGIIQTLRNEGLIKNALIITPSVPITTQFKDRAILRGYKESDIGLLYGKAKEFGRFLTCAVINTLAVGIKNKDDNIINLIKNADVIILDEAHHCSSDSFQRVVTLAESQYLIGLSGTPFKDRKKILDSYSDTLVCGLLGKVIMKISQRYLVDRGYIAETQIFMKVVPGSYKKYRAQFNTVYKREVTSNKVRNGFIVQYCKEFSNKHLTTIVSVNVKEHANILIRMVKEKYPEINVVCFFGGSEVAYMENGDLIKYPVDQDKFFQDVEGGMYDVVIATQVMDEGVDLPSVGALIMAGGGKSLRQVRQRLGRGVRCKKTGKNEVFILDFMDRGHIWMFSQSKKRLDIYLDEVETDVLERESEFLELIRSCDEES